MPLPPRWLRRILIAPGVVLLAFLLVTTLPVWLFIAAAASPLVPGYLRPLRVLWMACVYLVWDAAALMALFGLWVASGFGWKIQSPRFQRAHYVLTGWFLKILFWQARWTLRLRIDIVGTDPDTALPGRPELVLCRHAGPGDSFILIHALSTGSTASRASSSRTPCSGTRPSTCCSTGYPTGSSRPAASRGRR